LRINVRARRPCFRAWVKLTSPNSEEANGGSITAERSGRACRSRCCSPQAIRGPGRTSFRGSSALPPVSGRTTCDSRRVSTCAVCD